MRTLNRRHVLAGTAMAAGAGVVAWRGPKEPNEPESGGVGDEPTTSAVGASNISTAVLGPRLDVPIVVRWRSETFGWTFGGPAVTDGMIYHGTAGGRLQVFDAATGQKVRELQATHDTVADVEAVNGVVYYSSQDRIGGSLQAADVKSGVELWRFTPLEVVTFSFALAEGVVYVGASDGNTYAIDAATGRELWRFGTSSTLNAPTLANDAVIAGGYDGNLYAIDAATGVERWRFATGGEVGSPTVANGTVFVASNDFYLYAVDVRSGVERWRFTTGVEVQSKPAAANDLVFVDGGASLYALDAISGAQRWSFSAGEEHIFGGHVATPDGMVYLAGSNLYAIDARSGQERWRFASDSGWAPTLLAVADGVVYTNSGDDSFAALANLEPAVLKADVTLRVAPSTSAIEGLSAKAGASIDLVGPRQRDVDRVWVQVTLGEASGWIPIDTIDPVTMPPEGEINYVFVP